LSSCAEAKEGIRGAPGDGGGDSIQPKELEEEAHTAMSPVWL